MDPFNFSYVYDHQIRHVRKEIIMSRPSYINHITDPYTISTRKGVEVTSLPKTKSLNEVLVTLAEEIDMLSNSRDRLNSIASRLIGDGISYCTTYETSFNVKDPLLSQIDSLVASIKIVRTDIADLTGIIAQALSNTDD